MVSYVPKKLHMLPDYTLLLHGKQKNSNNRPCSTLDEVQFVLASTTGTSALNLPPTKDAFQQHCWRDMYQTAIWHASHLPKHSFWDPIGPGGGGDEIKTIT